MDGNVPGDPESAKTEYMDLDTPEPIKPSKLSVKTKESNFQVHSSYLMSVPGTPTDKISLHSYNDDETVSRASSPEFDYGPKRKTKPRVCTKHEFHTPEQMAKCLELMEKNRIASLKSRRKKINTIDKQREELAAINKKLKEKDGVIQRLVREKNDMSKQIVALQQAVLALQQKLQEKNQEASSDAEYVDVERVDSVPLAPPPTVTAPPIAENIFTKVPHIPQVQTQLMNNVTQNLGAVNLGKIPSPYESYVMNLVNLNTPEMAKTVNNILKVPEPQPSSSNTKNPKMVMQTTKTTIYSPRPNVLTIDDGVEVTDPKLQIEKTTFFHSPMFHSPELARIIQSLYPSPLKNVQIPLEQVPKQQ